MYTPYAGAAGKWKVQNMKLEIICFVVKKYLSHPTSHDNPLLSSFVTYHRVCNKNNTTGATSGVETVYTSGAHEFTPIVRVA
jgi:hypothetical protein